MIDLERVALVCLMILALIEEAELRLIKPGVSCKLAHMINSLACHLN